MNPSALNLIFSLRFDPVTWLLWAAGVLAYAMPWWRARRDPARLALWPTWRVVCFAAGALIALLALQSSAVSYTLNSMALYMGRLMVLGELVPPLIVLGIPKGLLRLPEHGPLRALLNFLLDPFVAFALWAAIIIYWNLPAGFSASIVSATTGTLLPFLYLFGGLLVWALLIPPLPSRLGGLGRGGLAVLATIPMMIVGAIWIGSPRVLYAPYVGVPCLWNSTPLGNQQISGWIMMLADLPALALAIGQVLGGLIALADSGTVTSSTGTSTPSEKS